MTTEEAITQLTNFKQSLCRYLFGKNIICALDMAINVLNQPEIIRCQDCKHSRPNDYDDDLYCNSSGYVRPDFYCKYGERKWVQKKL